LKSDFTSNIKNKAKNEPQKEKIKMYEKKVPEIIDWTSTFSNTRMNDCQGVKIKMAIITLIFAKPMRMKGKGFGTAYSIIERNMHSAEKNAILLNAFEGCCCIRIVWSPF